LEGLRHMIKRSVGEDYGILQKPVRIDRRYGVVHTLSPVHKDYIYGTY